MYYSKRAMLQNYNDSLIEHQNNFSDEELYIIEKIIQQIGEEELLYSGENVLIKFSINELTEKWGKNETLIKVIERVLRKLFGRFTLIRNFNNTNYLKIFPLFACACFTADFLVIEIFPEYVNFIQDIKIKHPNGRWKYTLRMTASNAAALYMVLQKYGLGNYFRTQYLRHLMLSSF